MAGHNGPLIVAPAVRVHYALWGHANADPNSDTYSHPDANADPNSHANADPHTGPDSRR